MNAGASKKVRTALKSHRFEHEVTGEPMPAYVIDGYVVEKARRDWDARPYRGSTGNPDRREWWEVRKQGSRTNPGVSIGPCLFWAYTLRECRAWIREARHVVAARSETLVSGDDTAGTPGHNRKAG